MAERSKTDMDADVQAALKGYKIRWQTREGAPYSAADLAKVSASAASTVILMRPDNSRVPFKDSDSASIRRQRFHQVSQQALLSLMFCACGCHTRLLAVPFYWGLLFCLLMASPRSKRMLSAALHHARAASPNAAHLLPASHL